MTWEWSHTEEAYHNAYAQLCQQSDEWLLECYAEWRAHEDAILPGGFDMEAYNRCHAVIRPTEDRQNMIAGIWRRAEEARRCTNGGHKLHMCPYGCHPVPVEPPTKKTDMTRDEAIEEACKIHALVFRAIADYTHSADGFCHRCPFSNRPEHFKNDGRIFDYMREAVVEKLQRDGYGIPAGFDQNGREIMEEET